MFLVTGGSGLLGHYVAERLAKEGEVVATYLNHPYSAKGVDGVEVNLEDADDVHRLVLGLKPEVIIHTAAMTNVDACEEKREEALKANVGATVNIAGAAKEAGAFLIHVSTEYVFDGKKGMYREEDKPNPLGFYAKTKWESEKAVEKVGGKWAVVRTSVPYGWPVQERDNFVTWVIGSLKKGERIRVIDDQANSPTYAGNFAEAMAKLAGMKRGGIFNVAGGERIDRFSFARKIADVFELDFSLVSRAKTKDLKQKSPRPADSSLDVGKAEKELKWKAMNVGEGLAMMKLEGKGSC